MKILFNSKSHKYSCGRKYKYSSVSGLVSQFKQPYNKEYWSRYKAYQRILGDEEFKKLRKGFVFEDNSLFDYLKQFVDNKEVNKVVKVILKEWEDKKDKSIIKGNDYHTFKENQAISTGVCYNQFLKRDFPTVQSTIITIKNNVEYRQPTVEDLFDLQDGFHPELILWNNNHLLAGQADKVYIETIDGVRYVDIDDYKTNEEIKKSNYFGKMLGPLSHLDCCNYNHYRLQISTYAWMLEQAGYTVRNTAFTHLNKPYVFDYLKTEVKLMLGIDPYMDLI